MRLLLTRAFFLLVLWFPSLAPAVTSIDLVAGWNLGGNSNPGSIDVVARFGDPSKVTTVWQWDASAMKWAFYAPSMTPSGLADFCQTRGYEVLTTINAKQGFWINAPVANQLALTDPSAPPPSPNDPVMLLTESDLPLGWSLLASADTKTPSELNASLFSSLNAANKAIVTTWAWDAPSMKWRFYARALEEQGGTALSDYLSSKAYLPFSAPLSQTDGFWMNMGLGSTGIGADLAVTKTCALDTVHGPQAVYCAVTVHNNGAVTSGAPITVTDTPMSPPTGTTFTSSSGSFGCAQAAGPVPTSMSCTYNGSIGVGQDGTTFFYFNVPQGGTFQNCASASQGGTVTDPVPANNSSICATVVVPAPVIVPDLTVTKTAVVTDNKIVYTITITNLNSSAVSGVIHLSDLLSNFPAGTVYDFGSGVGTCTTPVAGTAWDCEIPLANLGQPITIGIVMPVSGGSVTNCATISLAGETNTANNQACVTNVVPPVGTSTITIVKDARPNDPQSFHFTTSGPGLSPFDLVDSGSSGNSQTFTNLVANPAGGYTFTEVAVSGWTSGGTAYQGFVNCDHVSGPVRGNFSSTANSVTVSPADGESVSCTFINTLTPAQFMASAAPTLQVSTIAMIPTVLQTSTSFTSTGSGTSGTATVTAGPLGGFSPSNFDGIYLPASFTIPYPVYTLVGASASLPVAISLASGDALSMTASSLAGTVTPSLTFSDFGIWAIQNVVPLAGSQPPFRMMTYSAYEGGTQLTTTLPGGSVTYNGNLTGVLENSSVGGSDDVSGTVSLNVDFANGTVSGQLTNISNFPGASTLPGTTAFTGTFAPIVLSGGVISGNSFTATVATPSIVAPSVATLSGHFYGITASEIAGTFTISVPGQGTPGPGLTLIGSFGAR